jgi:hypothetical protein
VRCGAQYPTLNDEFFLTVASALELQADRATNYIARQHKAEAFREILHQSLLQPNIHESTRVMVSARAARGWSEYILSLGTNDISVSRASNAVWCLETTLRTLSTGSSPPPAVGKVMPPFGATGPLAAGMSPAGISDPKLRAEYEQRIKENMTNLKWRQDLELLKRTTEGLVAALRLRANETIDNLDGKGLVPTPRAGLFQGVIQDSKLSSEIKSRIVG